MVRLRLRELAEERGLSMSQVQRQSGLTVGMVRRYWHNQTSEISLEALEILARLLDVMPGDLLDMVSSDVQAKNTQMRARSA